MAATAVLPAPGDWQALQVALSKKQTFEGSAQKAATELAAAPAAVAQPAFRSLLARARTLLRSRFSSRPFWVAGRRLFSEAQQAASSTGDAAYAAQLAEWVAECTAFLGEEAAGSDSAAGGPEPATAAALRSRDAYLFEGQLSGQQQAPAAAPSLLDLLGGAFGQQLLSQAHAQAQAADDERQQQGSEQQSQEEEQQGEQQGGQQQQEDQPPAPPPELLEALERELDMIAVQIMEETGQAAAAQRARPPASKKAVASLPVEKLSAERLAQLGGAEAARCPVCMDELSEGEEVQVMPCSSSHCFHPPCLKPWLDQHNSCPTCRHELPTDDWKYEAAKEREREEEEERRGAANAVTHNEFLYV